MPETNATILIPDISGYTEFMTTTELNHSSQAINMFLNAMVEAVGEEYEVSEVEGDALLLIKKGLAPSRQQLLNTCLNIFNAFHLRRQWMELHSICPCNACLTIKNLTLKFVAHHGALTEIKVGKIVKQSGPNMIVAHRLLKNKIDGNEYLLVTENLWKIESDLAAVVELDWQNASEEYPSLGSIGFRYALLDEVRKNIPYLPETEANYPASESPYFEIPIAAHFRDVYMVLKNIPNWADWVPGLESVEQEYPEAFIGSIHYCTFEDYRSILSPVKMTLAVGYIHYTEKCTIEEKQVSVIHEYEIIQQEHDEALIRYRILNVGENPLDTDLYSRLSENQRIIMEKLRDHCESMEGSFF